MLWQGRREGGREDADDGSKCKIGWLIRGMEGWCMGVWAGVSEREYSLQHQMIQFILSS